VPTLARQSYSAAWAWYLPAVPSLVQRTVFAVLAYGIMSWIIHVWRQVCVTTLLLLYETCMFRRTAHGVIARRHGSSYHREARTATDTMSLICSQLWLHVCVCIGEVHLMLLQVTLQGVLDMVVDVRVTLHKEGKKWQMPQLVSATL